jgi:F-type H+-transporting ATPase subunit b
MFFATLLLRAAEEAPPPLIDLDGTVLVQFAFFVIMFVVLGRFMFRPYLKMRDERDKGIEGARKEARHMEESANKIVAEYDAQLNRAKVRGAEERTRLRGEAAIRERQLLGAARDEAQKVLGEARAKIAGEAATAKKGLELQSTVLAKQMAQKIVGREVA